MKQLLKILGAVAMGVMLAAQASAQWVQPPVTGGVSNLLSSTVINAGATNAGTTTNLSGNILPLRPDINGLGIMVRGSAAGLGQSNVTVYVGLSVDGTNFPNVANAQRAFLWVLNSNAVTSAGTNFTPAQLAGYKALRIVGALNAQTNAVTISNAYGFYHYNPNLQNR